MIGYATTTDAVERFELRQYLLGVAYRILGTLGDAEDTVQEALARWYTHDPTKVRDARKWLTTVVSRIAIDQLRSARRQREMYVGPWLPEPIVEDPDGRAEPESRVVFEESVHMAMLVVLETLTPAERTVFVLHEVFDLPHQDIAKVIGRSPAACRQLDMRARKHVRSGASRYELSPQEQRAASSAFLAACDTGDLVSLLRILDRDVVVHSDGGGVIRAARRPVHGADRVARYLLRVRERWHVTLRPAVVNGSPGLIAERQGTISAVISLAMTEGKIAQVDIVLNPAKLRHASNARWAPASLPSLPRVRAMRCPVMVKPWARRASGRASAVRGSGRRAPTWSGGVVAAPRQRQCGCCATVGRPRRNSGTRRGVPGGEGRCSGRP